jgi:hypothetical protein
MHARLRAGRSLRIAIAATLLVAMPPALVRSAETVMVEGRDFVNKGLVGVGRMPAALRDQYGETVGSGSGLAADPNAWLRAADGYHGIFYMLPDRGYNLGGTSDFRARLYKLEILFNPASDPNALSADERQRTVTAKLAETILLKEASGVPLTGLDPRRAACARRRMAFRRCRRPRPGRSASTRKPWCAWGTAASISVTNMGRTSTTSLPVAT